MPRQETSSRHGEEQSTIIYQLVSQNVETSSSIKTTFLPSLSVHPASPFRNKRLVLLLAVGCEPPGLGLRVLISLNFNHLVHDQLSGWSLLVVACLTFGALFSAFMEPPRKFSSAITDFRERRLFGQLTSYFELYANSRTVSRILLPVTINSSRPDSEQGVVINRSRFFDGLGPLGFTEAGPVKGWVSHLEGLSRDLCFR